MPARDEEKQARAKILAVPSASNWPSNWYAIVGGPSSGKTTVLRELERRGFRIVDEVARGILERELAKGRQPAEVRKDDIAFQVEIFQTKLRRDPFLPRQELMFFDTGLPDGVAYLLASGVISKISDAEHPGFEITEAREVMRKAREIKYKKVFLLEQLPYKYDGIRIEGEENARKIGRSLRELYDFLGFEIVDVPAITPEKRVELILSHVES